MNRKIINKRNFLDGRWSFIGSRQCLVRMASTQVHLGGCHVGWGGGRRGGGHDKQTQETLLYYGHILQGQSTWHVGGELSQCKHTKCKPVGTSDADWLCSVQLEKYVNAGCRTMCMKYRKKWYVKKIVFIVVNVTVAHPAKIMWQWRSFWADLGFGLDCLMGCMGCMWKWKKKFSAK